MMRPTSTPPHFFLQHSLPAVDLRDMRLLQNRRHQHRSDLRGIVRTHAFDASLTYARGNSAHGELVIEANAVRWRSGRVGAPETTGHPHG